jgi:cysteine desulfurase
MRCRAPEAVLVVDAAQSFGRHRLPWRTAGIDALVLSARKIGGPAGVAALVIRRGLRLEPILYGGGQQGNLRPGTLDAVGIVEMARASRLVCAGRVAESARIAALNRFLRERLNAWTKPALRILSPPEASPWILTFAVPGYEGAILMRMLAEKGILVATGSACSAESGKTSHVLRAMGVPEGLARCVLRVSFGRHTTQEHLERLLIGLRTALDTY